ncbi:hypothetical protein [Mucilaginibacter sp.]|uniref:hypothetical protein n=1 Tax=Mucilaginibacter sp. TaxID=1882438 RepID=UPI00262524A1|nr:hypothetical protein [Mucilaginibacter sp.]MDB5029461.1 hypothetical protein [Mucilaginibacter sp.]
MIAELFIIPESFVNNSNFTIEELEFKIKALSQDCIQIRKYKADNHLYVHSDIYNVVFVNGLTVGELLYNPEVAKENIDRDVYNALKTIIMESANAEYTTADIINILLPEHSEDICHGLIAFEEIPKIEQDYQIIYSLQGWYDFRRHFLGLYPKNPIFFIDECKIYFPDLFFHERNKGTIGTILHNCPKTIVFHLAALNDKFGSIVIRNMNRTEVLRQFSVASNFPENASLEGNSARKQDFTFAFLNDDSKYIDVCCEPHLKLCFNDNYPGDNSYSNDRRIYFHEGIYNIEKNKILIGHIGNHL